MSIDLKTIGGAELCLGRAERVDLAAYLSRKGSLAKREDLGLHELKQMERTVSKCAFDGIHMVGNEADLDKVQDTLQSQMDQVVLNVKAALREQFSAHGEFISNETIRCMIDAVCDCARAILLEKEFMTHKRALLAAQSSQARSLEKLMFAQWLRRKGFNKPGVMVQRHSAPNSNKQEGPKLKKVSKKVDDSWADQEFKKRAMRRSA